VRVVFESERIPVTATIPSDAGTQLDGATVEGVAWLTMKTFDPGEAIPAQHDHARPLAVWREQLRGRPPGSTLPDAFRPKTGAREVVVPPRLLEGLPPETIIAVDWEFEPAKSHRP
jgi:hypothetical protein